MAGQVRLTWRCDGCGFEDVVDQEPLRELLSRERTGGTVHSKHRDMPLSEYPAPDCGLCGKKMRLRRRAPVPGYNFW